MAELLFTGELRIYTTPAELRRIADQMEAHWLWAEPGGSVEVVGFVDNDSRLTFLIDETKMPPRSAP